MDKESILLGKARHFDQLASSMIQCRVTHSNCFAMRALRVDLFAPWSICGAQKHLTKCLISMAHRESITSKRNKSANKTPSFCSCNEYQMNQGNYRAVVIVTVTALFRFQSMVFFYFSLSTVCHSSLMKYKVLDSACSFHSI